MKGHDKTLKAEQYANDDTRLLRALLDAAVDAIIVIDRYGLILTFNRAAEHMFGYQADEVLGQNVKQLMPEPYQSEHDVYLHQYQITRQAKIIGIGREVMARHKDGTLFSVKLSVGEAGDHVNGYFVGILHDLTGLRQVEGELYKQQQRMVHFSRLGVLGEMTAGIAHEINQPLTAISTYAEACARLIKNKGYKAAEIAEILELIRAQALRAGEVIRRLRDLAVQHDSERCETDLNKLIIEVVKLAGVDAHLNDIKIITDLESRLPLVIVDSVQIQQVLLNLIRNAIDAMTDAGPEKNTIVIRSNKISPEMIEISVIDQGHGIADEMVDKLFEPFHSSKAHGMGIGLSISRTIITSHGGSLKFESIPGQGATFKFCLPSIPELLTGVD